LSPRTETKKRQHPTTASMRVSTHRNKEKDNPHSPPRCVSPRIETKEFETKKKSPIKKYATFLSK
jgi:hypothetical protein